MGCCLSCIEDVNENVQTDMKSNSVMHTVSTVIIVNNVITSVGHGISNEDNQ